MFHIPKLVIGLFFARLLVLTGIERRRPAHAVRYREVVPRDIAAALVITFAISPLASLINNQVHIPGVFPAALMELPLAVRFAAYMVISDFGHYWVHRLMHTQLLWRTHKWHHSPTYLYWLAGVRGSLLQTVLVNLPYIFAEGLLDFSWKWMGVIIFLKNVAENDWMHLNRSWGSRWLEWLIVTPRYHHVHHSDQPAHYRGNLATIFSVWDRLFGTYVDPDKVKGPLSFGIGERVPVIRLAVGI